MSAADMKKYLILFAVVVVSIGVANTLGRRVPVAGALIQKVMAGV